MWSRCWWCCSGSVSETSVDVLLLGAELVGVAALALAAVGGTRRETSVALAAVASQSVFPSLVDR